MATYTPRAQRDTNHRPYITPEYLEKTMMFLVRSFASTTYKAAKIIGTKTETPTGAKTELYDYQVEFAYLLDNIKRCPQYFAPKYIQEANDLITGIKALIPPQ